MKRFTICGLRAFVDYVNETVPKIEESIFLLNLHTVIIVSFCMVTEANMEQPPKIHTIRAVRRESVSTLLANGF